LFWAETDRKTIFFAVNGSIKGKKGPKRGEIAKTDRQIIILAKTDRLNKYFRRPKRKQWDSTVFSPFKVQTSKAFLSVLLSSGFQALVHPVGARPPVGQRRDDEARAVAEVLVAVVDLRGHGACTVRGGTPGTEACW
jgi:hypothetical protein